MKIGALWFHQQEQYDVVDGGVPRPWIVIAWRTPAKYSRLFCIWSGGICMRIWKGRHFFWRWGK